MKGSWAQLRAAGMKRCIYRVVRSEGDSEKYRRLAREVGDRCRAWVGREAVAERGLPICSKHWPVFQRDVQRERETRKRLRSKYDPGPLPLDE